VSDNSVFLEPTWFESMNHRLRAVALDPALVGDRVNVRILFEIDDTPANCVTAMTFSVDEHSARLEPISAAAADLVVSLAYTDAVKISSGEIPSSQALRDGRLKVRGDVNALIQFSAWMAAAHEAMQPKGV
jgi:putative sterol carrier protein